MSITPETEEDAAGAKPLPPVSVLFGSTPPALEVMRRLEIVATTDLPVILQGEPGTGKELVARWIHSLSPFANGPFIKTSSMVSATQESRPFSTEDVWSGEGGILEQLLQIRTGTLFLDDVGSLALTTQALLSKTLWDGSAFETVANPERVGVTLRIISATRSDLRQEIAKGAFRSDFFHSISAFTQRMMPLRERMEELPDLVGYFIDLHSRQLGLEPPPLSSNAISELLQYQWPGNFHELEDLLIGYVLTGGEELLMEKVRALQRSGEAMADEPETMQVLDRRGAKRSEGKRAKLDDAAIVKALTENHWNRRRTAGRLQMNYRTLLNRLKKIDLNAGRNWVPSRG